MTLRSLGALSHAAAALSVCFFLFFLASAVSATGGAVQNFGPIPDVFREPPALDEDRALHSSNSGERLRLVHF